MICCVVPLSSQEPCPPLYSQEARVLVGLQWGFLVGLLDSSTTKIYMGRILVELDLLSPLRGILWVPHRQAPSTSWLSSESLALPLQVLLSRNKMSSECFLEWNLVALLGIFEWWVLFEEKVHPSGCSPRASCYLEQGAGGSCLEVVLIVRWSFIKKNSNMARSGFFLS